MAKKYMEPIEKSYDFAGAIEEAGRCLLCLDAPCSKDCPAGTDPGRFIRSTRFNNFKGAAETIRLNNALGSICARVCPTERYCQANCPRGEIDRPIDIGRIQQFLTDYENDVGLTILEKGKANGFKVAIVGSGPSGLQAATNLARLGYKVTIYDKNEKPGGQLRYGIPEYRLSNKIVDIEIKRIKDLGVTIKNNVNIGDNVTIDDLKRLHDAVILAPGYSLGKYLKDYVSHPDVEIALDFLKKVKDSKGKITLPKDVLVVGGGDVAMDASSTLKLLGVENVTCAIYELSNELRASKKELETTRDLGVTMIYGYHAESVNKKQVILKHRKIDAKIILNPDKVVLAVGQIPYLVGLSVLQTDIVPGKYTTTDPKIFVTGDLADGDKTVVYAVRNGKFAAQAVHEYLGGGIK